MNAHRAPVVTWSFVVALAVLMGCEPTAVDRGPHVDFVQVFSSTDPTVYSSPFDWSPDGSTIAFEGGAPGSSDVFTVTAIPGSLPVRVTKWSSPSWDSGGEAVSYLTNGLIAYYVGWFYSVDDKDMHIMQSSAGQVACSPAPIALRRFNGSLVGMTNNAAASPDRMMVSGDGQRAVVLWSTTAYLLDWSTNADTARAECLTGLTDIAISRDGSSIALVDTGFNVTLRNFSGGALRIVGPGRCVSFALDGRVGYIDGNDYAIVNPATDSVKKYDAGTPLQQAYLSWDGAKIAVRTFGGASTGIEVGYLRD